MKSDDKGAKHDIAKVAIEESGDLRRLIKNVIVGVMHGDINASDASAIIKGAKEINVSLYSEIKYAFLLKDLGRDIPELGKLPLFNKSKP